MHTFCSTTKGNSNWRWKWFWSALCHLHRCYDSVSGKMESKRFILSQNVSFFMKYDYNDWKLALYVLQEVSTGLFLSLSPRHSRSCQIWSANDNSTPSRGKHSQRGSRKHPLRGSGEHSFGSSKKQLEATHTQTHTENTHTFHLEEKQQQQHSFL